MVTTIAVTDHEGNSRTVNTLDIVTAVEDAAAAGDPTGIHMMARRRDTLVTNEVSATADVIALNASSRGELHVNMAAHAASPTKLEDAAHTTADMGMAILGVRRDTAASGADTDGDYATINLDANGRLFTNPTPTPGAAVAAKAEDAAHSSADVGNFVLAVRADTAAVTGQTDGDYSAFIVDANGRLHCNALVSAAAASIGKAEDAAHSTGETGAYVLGVRRDTSATTATTDGDYSSFTLDANGKLWCRVGANDTLYTEDAAAASDPAGPMMMAVRRDTLTTGEVSGDGDNVALKADSRGALHVAIAATALSIAKAEDAAAASGDVGVPAMAVQTTTAADAATAGDYAMLQMLDGRLYVRNRDEGPMWTTVWGVSAAPVTSADASGGVVSCTDAPTSTQKIVVDKIHVGVAANMTVTFKCETSGAVISGPHSMLAGTTLELNFGGSHAKGPKLGTADKKLQFITSASGAVTVNVAYHSEA